MATTTRTKQTDSTDTAQTDTTDTKQTDTTDTAQTDTAQTESPNGTSKFASLQFEDSPEPVSTGRSATWKPDPAFLAVLEASWAGRKVHNERSGYPTTYIGSAKRVTVPTKDAGTVVNALRKTATSMKLGLSVSTEAQGNKTVIRFAAKTPKASSKDS